MIIRVFNIKWDEGSKYRPSLPKEVVWEVDDEGAEIIMASKSDWPTAARWIGTRLMAFHRCAYDTFEYEWIA